MWKSVIQHLYDSNSLKIWFLSIFWWKESPQISFILIKKKFKPISLIIHAIEILIRHFSSLKSAVFTMYMWIKWNKHPNQHTIFSQSYLRATSLIIHTNKSNSDASFKNIILSCSCQWYSINKTYAKSFYFSEQSLFLHFDSSQLQNFIHVVLCAIWHHLYNLKNVENTHGGKLILVKLQASACNFTKINTPPWVFFTFFKLYKWCQIAQRIQISFRFFCRGSTILA